jgi:hypothetical protein
MILFQIPVNANHPPDRLVQVPGGVDIQTHFAQSFQNPEIRGSKHIGFKRGVPVSQVSCFGYLEILFNEKAWVVAEG